jgi:diguanylate cyclase (GGDEF)-like protein/PAS domain S-box-containing protein
MASAALGGEGRAASVLRAGAFAYQRFAEDLPWEEAMPDVLRELGRAAEVHRVHVFKSARQQDGSLQKSGVFEWCAPGFGSTIRSPENQDVRDGARSGRQLEMLGAGGVIFGTVTTLPESERRNLRDEGVLSVAIVPIYSGSRWWGFIGFDDCLIDRQWTEVELEALKAVANILGATIARKRGAGDTEHFQELVEQIPAIVYVDDIRDGYRTTYVGPQLETILGISQHEWITDPGAWAAHMHPDDREFMTKEYEEYRSTGGTLIQEYRVIRPDNGRIVWIRDDCTLFRDQSGRPSFVQGVMFDITTQKTLEEQLRAAEATNRTLIEQIPAVVFIRPLGASDEAYVSPSVETILGCSRESWLGTAWWDEHLHHQDRAEVLRVHQSLIDGGDPIRIEYRMVTGDDRLVSIEEVAKVISKDGRPWVVQGLIQDITQRKDAEADIVFLAYHDKLTGLLNRAVFEEHLEAAVARAVRNDRAVAVLFLDLDQFKEVNDSLGHSAGDELLRHVAKCLSSAIRESDIVARQGGDEFLVLLPDLEYGNGTKSGRHDKAVQLAEMIAQRIRTLLEAPFTIGDCELRTSASIGSSIYPLDATDGRTLIQNADAAMYRRKQGR